ncbi:hypothetical protein GPX89_09250 [Nocardia sp. ET3-3]|uniref:Uncharacterized protein n=1 Tax=Nocardia terrae TaxID=2675851 RepID=A0A7K1USV2_9NOCA|nr:hypothetical protein [Nocardia terrae]MVU77433.1 hypothetical protein [Nocardia terrae]
MNPNITLNEVRQLIQLKDELGLWKRDYDCNEAVRILIALANNVAALDQLLSQGGFLPRDWEWARTASKGTAVKLAETHILDRSQLSAVIGDALEYLTQVGEIVGDIEVAGEQIVSAIGVRWTVFTNSPEVPA